MYIYVASSWRNDRQQDVVYALRAYGFGVYDFMHPPGGDHLGFNWGDVDPAWERWTGAEYVAALDHPIAQAGFDSDYDAMRAADACVLVLPCGRSAHLEAGYFVGAGKPLYILLDDREFAPVHDLDNDGTGRPWAHNAHQRIELMYKMATYITFDQGRIIDLLLAQARITGHFPNGARIETPT